MRSWRLAAVVGALILNRESSLLVLSALLLAVLAAGHLERRPAAARRQATIIGVIAFLNVALVLLLRHALYVRSTRPAIVVATAEMATGNFMQLASNLRLFFSSSENLFVRSLAVAIITTLAVLSLLSIRRLARAARGKDRLTPGEIFLHAYLVLTFLAIIVFADARESRVYFELTPLLIILGAEATGARPWGVPATEPGLRL